MVRGVSTFTEDQSEYLEFLMKKDVLNNRCPNYAIILKRFKARFKSLKDITVEVIRKHIRGRMILKEKYNKKARATKQEYIELRSQLETLVAEREHSIRCENQQAATRQQITMISEQYENTLALLESVKDEVDHYKKLYYDERAFVEKLESTCLRTKKDKMNLICEMDKNASIISNMNKENQHLKQEIDRLYKRMNECSRMSSKSDSWEICYYNEVNKVEYLERRVYELVSQNIAIRNEMEIVDND